MHSELNAAVDNSKNTTDRSVFLCADDFALSGGVSDAILALAEVGRLSATSAIVTTSHWEACAPSLVRLRRRLAIGLHLNLTHGHPLGPMRDLTSEGTFPSLNALVRTAFADHAGRLRIEAEVELQLERFMAEVGFPPDFVDSHQHVHVLPGIRQIVIATLKRRFPAGGLFIRDPSDSPKRIAWRRISGRKALGVAALAIGFRQLALANGFVVNSGFSGFSTFGPVPYSCEFDSFLLCPGQHHIIMCHPGFMDNEVGSQDSIAHRRPEEYAVLSVRPDIPRIISRPFGSSS